MTAGSASTTRLLLPRLSVLLFFAELAHGMLLYGIIVDLVQHRFPPGGLLLFNLLPVKEEVAALCLAAYTLAELVSKVPAGHWVDRVGPDVPLRTGLAVSLLTVPLILLSREPHLMLLGAFLHGMGAAPIWPAVISAWTRGRSAHERGEIMGQILTGWMAGLGTGVIAGKFLIALSGRAEVVVNCAPIMLWLTSIGAALWTGGRLAPAGPAVDGEGESDATGRFPPELKVMAIGLFLQNLAFGALIIPFNLLAEQHLRLNPFQVGMALLLGGGPAVMLLSPMGRIADRVGRRRAVIGSMFVVSPLVAAGPFMAYLPLDSWQRLALMLPGLLLAGAAYAFLLPAWHALALGRIPEGQRGRSLALLMSVEMAALAGGHTLGTPLYTRTHFALPFVVAGGVFFVLACAYSGGWILPSETPDEPLPVRLD